MATPVPADDLDRTILAALEQGVVVRRASGEIVRCNPAAERLIGLTRSQLAGTHPRPDGWRMIRPDGSTVATTMADLRAIDHDDPVRMVVGVHHPDGRQAWLEATSVATRGPDDEPLAITTLVDITSVQQATADLETSRRTSQALADAAPIGVFATDATGNCTYVNPQWERIHGVSFDDAMGRGWWEAIHPDDRHDVVRARDRATTDGTDLHIHYRVVRRDGSIRWVRAGSTRTVDGSGRTSGAVGTVEDVTVEFANREALRAAEQRYRVAFENAPLALLEADAGGVVLFANYATAELLARPMADIIGADVCALLGFDSAESLLAAGSGSAAVGPDSHGHHRIRTPSGDARSLLLRVACLEGSDPDTAGQLLVQMADLTDRLMFEERLRHLADHDPLTGLLNRRSFSEVLDRHVARVARHGPTGVLFVLDLDNFKAVNDTLGHGAGDHVIISVARALQRRLRDEDYVARLGGDEIAVLVPSCDPGHAEVVARDLVEAVRNEVIPLPTGTTRRMTASVGVAVCDGRNHSAETLMAAADIALYDAKDAGRDGFVVADQQAQQSRNGSAISWIERIEQALERDALELHAQPIVELATGRVAQHELLIRMIGSQGQRIPPAPWLVVAERTGLIRKIDRWVCASAIDMLSRTMNGSFEVNLSGLSLGDIDLLEAIAQGLTDAGVDPNRLIIEVTETAAISNLTNAQSFIAELRSLGCRFALDDFGAGFGSFYYLKHLPFDFLKIDGEFVRHCDTDAADRSIIRSVVDIAGELGTHVIAEHVQTPEVLETIVALGVTHGQGYLLGEPRAIAVQPFATHATAATPASAGAPVPPPVP